MDQEPKKPAETTEPPEESDEDALETPEGGGATDVSGEAEASSGGAEDNITDATGGAANKAAAAPPAKDGLRKKLRKFNIYLLFFALILVVAGVIIAIAYFQSKKASTSATIKTQTLTQNALNQVASSDATVGNNGQILNIQSNAVFAGQVLVRSNLQVAGSLQIGGTVALSALTVSGTTQLGQLQVNSNLSVNGDTGIQGALTVSKSLQVNGGGSFSGNLTAPQITTSSFQLNGDLILTHHVVAGGANPGQSSGPALGGGGTASVSGSDTSGSITINTGSSPGAGCFVNINFVNKYNATPHVIISPVGSAAGNLAFYVNRSPTGFSVCDATAPPGGSSFGFDYFVVD